MTRITKTTKSMCTSNCKSAIQQLHKEVATPLFGNTTRSKPRKQQDQDYDVSPLLPKSEDYSYQRYLPKNERGTNTANKDSKHTSSGISFDQWFKNAATREGDIFAHHMLNRSPSSYTGDNNRRDCKSYFCNKLNADTNKFDAAWNSYQTSARNGTISNVGTPDRSRAATAPIITWVCPCDRSVHATKMACQIHAARIGCKTPCTIQIRKRPTSSTFSIGRM